MRLTGSVKFSGGKIFYNKHTAIYKSIFIVRTCQFFVGNVLARVLQGFGGAIGTSLITTMLSGFAQIFLGYFFYNYSSVAVY